MNRRAFVGGSLGVRRAERSARRGLQRLRRNRGRAGVCELRCLDRVPREGLLHQGARGQSGPCSTDRDPETRTVGCGSAREGALDLLRGAGDVAPAPEDFDFQWPDGTFRSEKEIVATGTRCPASAARRVSDSRCVGLDPAYRVLYASLAASVSQQLATLAARAGQNAIEPFPTAMDLEAASDALDAYLG